MYETIKDWILFLGKHGIIFLCLNTMIYTATSKNILINILGFFTYIAAHLSMFEYYCSSAVMLKTTKPVMNQTTASKKRSPKLECRVKCVSDSDGMSHLDKEKEQEGAKEVTNQCLEKMFTIKVNHDLIVSVKEIKALLWAMNQRLCASNKSMGTKSIQINSRSDEQCESLTNHSPTGKNEGTEETKIIMPTMERKAKRPKYASFHGIEKVEWE